MEVKVRAKVDETTNEVYINANDMLLFWTQVKDGLKKEVSKVMIKGFIEWINDYKNEAQKS